MTSPTGVRYRYTGYLLFDYFITEENGEALVEFEADSSHHVLWKRGQRPRTPDDGPVVERVFDPDPASNDAYDEDFGETNVGVFGEWERLPTGGVHLPPGTYGCRTMLTEESFHGSGGDYAGRWAGVLTGEVEFTITDGS